MSLSQSEASLLECLEKIGGKADATRLATELGLPESSIFPLSSLLSIKGYVTLTELLREKFTLTEEGAYCSEHGMPETRLIALLKSKGGSTPMAEVGKMLKPNEVSAALGWGRKNGSITVEKKNGVLAVVLNGPAASEYEPILSKLKAGAERQDLISVELKLASELQSRGLVALKESKQLIIQLVPGKGMPEAVLLNVLTSDIIKGGKWKVTKLRPFDVTASPPCLDIGKKQPYLEFLDEVKEILIGMGFEETTGNFVEPEFWNFDVLFQAQDHPARAVHDSFQVKGFAPEIDAPAELIRGVKQVHENGGNTGSKGWGYSWDISTAKQAILRTQTTVTSVRYLSAHKEPPLKAFCLSKVFRPDVIDSRHMIEFSQLDGIIGNKGINVRHLLGILTEFGKQLGFTDIKFVPGYFPFTEPSIEAYVKHPKLGWIECLGSGLFRPEVLEPLGIKFPVIAWGIGIDRLAMIRLGVDNIRDLHSTNLESLREWGWW